MCATGPRALPRKLGQSTPQAERDTRSSRALLVLLLGDCKHSCVMSGPRGKRTQPREGNLPLAVRLIQVYSKDGDLLGMAGSIRHTCKWNAFLFVVLEKQH